MILCKDVSFSYGNEKKVLKKLNLELKPGLALLLGPNGCGKSTLLRLLAGVEMPDSGEISINGIDLWEKEVEARSQLTYFPENPDLTPYATIKEILYLVCRLRGLPLKCGEKVLKETGLEHLMNCSVRELSNGQRRRAVFACCLVVDASVVFMDEPLEGMDAYMQKKIFVWLDERKNDGATILVASHALEKFISFADQAVTIRRHQAVHHKDLPADRRHKQLFLEEIAG